MSIGWPNTVAWHGKDYILDAAGWGSKDSVDPRGMAVMFAAREDARFSRSGIVHRPYREKDRSLSAILFQLYLVPHQSLCGSIPLCDVCLKTDLGPMPILASPQFPKEQSESGEFVRQQDAFRRWITSDPEGELRPPPHRYHFYVPWARPWPTG